MTHHENHKTHSFSASVDRRAFIRASAAAAGAAVLAPHSPLSAAEPSGAPRVRPNILYALSTGSWGRVTAAGRPLPLLEILDETAAAGFNGVRLTGFPDILERNGLTVEQYGDHLARRGLKFSTVSFGGEYHNPDKHAEIRERARQALAAHRRFGATALVFFPPGPVAGADEAATLAASFAFMNELGKMAIDEFGIRIGLHNHTDSMIENQAQVDRFLEGTDPRYVFCAWDTAHLHLGGCDVQSTFKKSIDRIVYTDFKDATRTPVETDYVSPIGERFAGDSHQGRFFNSMLELGRGQIDFVALMRMLAQRKYRGWINHDLDTIRVSTAESWRVSMNYIRENLDPLYE
jgi:inosose dehydratase